MSTSPDSPPCHGSSAFRPHLARRDYPPTTQFLAQDYVLLGRSTLPEFGLTASTEYADRAPTRNPWNTDHSVDASSGGAAALVASGAVAIAHDNDGGGSLRIPAAAGSSDSRRRGPAAWTSPRCAGSRSNLVAEGYSAGPSVTPRVGLCSTGSESLVID